MLGVYPECIVDAPGVLASRGEDTVSEVYSNVFHITVVCGHLKMRIQYSNVYRDVIHTTVVCGSPGTRIQYSNCILDVFSTIGCFVGIQFKYK